MGKLYYERNLPHFQPRGATFFLTYRLHGSLPQSFLFSLRQEFEALQKAVMEKHFGAERKAEFYKLQKRYFHRYDVVLDKGNYGPTWLAERDIAKIVADSLHHIDGKYFTLYAYSILSNHVHVVFKHHEEAPELFRILQSHKSYTGKLANKALNHSGQFWLRETYDHQVREAGEFQRILQYVIENPVKAGLVGAWNAWPFTFIREDLLFS